MAVAEAKPRSDNAEDAVHYSVLGNELLAETLAAAVVGGAAEALIPTMFR